MPSLRQVGRIRQSESCQKAAFDSSRICTLKATPVRGRHPRFKFPYVKRQPVSRINAIETLRRLADEVAGWGANWVEPMRSKQRFELRQVFAHIFDDTSHREQFLIAVFGGLDLTRSQARAVISWSQYRALKQKICKVAKQEALSIVEVGYAG